MFYYSDEAFSKEMMINSVCRECGHLNKEHNGKSCVALLRGDLDLLYAKLESARRV